MGIFRGGMPDVTAVQLISAVVAACALAAALGLPVSQSTQDAIVNFITVAFPIALAADAYLRGARNKARAAGLADPVDG